MITIQKLTTQNFFPHSLDQFPRHQVVTECWRKVNEQWGLYPIAFTEEWGPETLRANARELIAGLKEGMLGFGAFDGDHPVGCITMGTQSLGSRGQYRQVVDFHTRL